jgi:hypothetical protein
MLLLGARSFQPRADLPPLDYILNRPSLEVRKDNPYPEADRKRWSEFLQDYDWYSADELDYELATFVRTGCFTESSINEAVASLRKQIEDHEAHTTLNAACSLFHDSLEDNERELIDELYGTHLKHISAVSPMNLDAVVRLLRDLNAGDKASELIRRYVEVHKGNREILNLENYALASKLQDNELRNSFETAFKAIPEHKELGEVLTRIANSRSWGSSDKEFLSSLSVDDYERFFSALKGAQLDSCIKAALQFGRFQNADDIDKKVGSLAGQALSRIAASSRVSRLRLSRYGIAAPQSE